MLIPTAFAQSKLDFTLHNNTGYEISEVYVSPSTKNNWEEDVLGQDTLADGAQVDITFTRQKSAIWDLRVVFVGGREAVWTRFNLTQLTDITISFKCEPIATTQNGG
jgi:hypothetical protein